MKKSCPRCKVVFDCQSNTDKHCFCAEVKLSDDTKTFLKKTYYDCLCADCLKELDEIVAISIKKPFNPRFTSLKEGEYFYKENGKVVFTELYHISKGSCCNSGCRHCAYGFTACFLGM